MVDVLAFGAHPDDVELSVGGTLLLLRQKGYSVAIIDLTRGELSTNGSVEERCQEAEAAAFQLGATRENLEFPDGDLQDTPPRRRILVEAIRRYQPSLVLYPHPVQEHPDHQGASQLISAALYLARIRRYGQGGAYRPAASWRYYHTLSGEPDWVVDVTRVYEEKLQLILTYASQFLRLEEGGYSTAINEPTFLHRIRSRDQYLGSQVGVSFGEGFLQEGPLLVEDPMDFFIKEEPK